MPFVVKEGGWLGAEARELVSKVVEHCDISERAKKAATIKILRAVHLAPMHTHLYMMAKFLTELQQERQNMAQFAAGAM